MGGRLKGKGVSQDARRGASRRRCAANFGGQRMTRPQRRPATDEPSAAWSERFRTGDALAGVPACLGGFGQRCVTERRSGSARSRPLRRAV